MRYFTKAFFGFLACLVVFFGAVFAEEFRGKITEVSVLAGIVIVQLEGDPKKPKEEMLVNLKEKMKLEGVKSTADLMLGDEIAFDASKSFFGTWSFNTLKRISSKRG